MLFVNYIKQNQAGDLTVLDIMQILYCRITKWGAQLYLYSGHSIYYVNVNKTKQKCGKIEAIFFSVGKNLA